jgi:probable HAF family extracellular repeat protein
MRWLIRLTIGVLIFLIATRAQQTRPTSFLYTVTELPLSPAAINDSGVVAGTVMHDLNPVHAASWSARNGLQLLGSIPSAFQTSEATGINNAGVVVGNLIGPLGNPVRGAIFSQGKFEQLESAGNARAYAINNSDQVVGESILTNAGGTHSVMWNQKGVPVNLGDCCGGVAKAINDSGQVVGYMWSSNHRYEAFLWDRTHGIVRLAPSERFSTALAINSSGDVLVETAAGFSIYHQATSSLSKLPVGKGVAAGVNNLGQIVGAAGPVKDHFRALIWDAIHETRDLNSLIPEDSGWVLEGATGINNKGQIVGWGEHRGEDSYFLLTPSSPSEAKE